MSAPRLGRARGPHVRLGSGAALACVLSLLALGSPAGAPSARADAAAEARFFDGLARAEFAARHYERALALFLDAYRAAPSPGALYNIGYTAMLAREEPLAYAHFEEFLASASTDTVRREDAARRMAEMESRLARVRVESDPPGATITVDRADDGALGRTPRTIVVAPGHHVVTLSRDGHEAVSAEIDAAVGTLVEVSRPLPAVLGAVDATITPPSARIVARTASGEEIVVEDASAGPLRLPVGRYTLRIEASGFVGAERELVVSTGAAVALRVRLEALPTPMGRLLVDTGAVTGRVWVDGSARASTPATLSLGVGAHAVRVEADGHRPWEGTVEIAEGRARFLDLVLVPVD